jgi:hypothetical protein
MPARVERYDEATQKIDAFPLLLDSHNDAEGNRQTTPFAVIAAVPVLWPAGGGFRLTFPLAKGDTVLLVFSDKCLDGWLERGGLVDPVDPRLHHLTDAIAIPGLHDFAHAFTGARTDALTLGKDGSTQLHIEAGAIRLGSQSAAQQLVLGTAFKAALNGFIDALSLYTGAIQGIADPTTVATTALGVAATALKNAAFLSNVSRTD